MPRQLAFDLPVRPALGRDAFFVSSANRTALAAIEAWPTWPQKRHLLIGPEGSGKTHLAHVWAALSSAELIAGPALTVRSVAELSKAKAVAVEDADRDAPEDALLHLLNLAQAEGTALLLTARRRPADWNVALPDLASRLAAMPVARLAPPDDALLAALLVKQFEDRQLAVDAKVVDYLLSRIDRSSEAVRSIVAALDSAALSERRPVTTRLAAAVLDKAGAGGS